MADPSPENQETMPGLATPEDLEMPLSTPDATIPNDLAFEEPPPVEHVATSGVTDAAPKKVFSLFLSPEERRLKMEREAAAARDAAASKSLRSASTDGAKRGKKVKKVVHNIFAPSSSPTTSPNVVAADSTTSEAACANGPRKSTVTKLSAHVPGTGDPSLAPHPFFAEMSKEARAATQASDAGQGDKFVPRYKWSRGREPAPYPSDQCHYHGSFTKHQQPSVVGEMNDTLASSPDRCENGKYTHKNFGWYALRTLDDTSKLGTDQSTSAETRIGRPQLMLSGREEPSPTEQNQFEGKPGDLWIDKYRPRSGADVLGNRPCTEYLTRWLKGLEVSAWSLGPIDPHHPTNSNPGSKRSISGIGRPKKRTRKSKVRGDDDLSDFIVDDEFDGDDYYGSDGDQGDETFSPQPNLSPFARYGTNDYCIGDAAQPKKLDSKVEIRSNIILLSGPSGSGKTAAVYACAEETGYEVFEVSPGSKRAGRDVLALVGEMAENHHVHVVSNGTGTNSTNNSAPNTPASSTSVNGEISTKRSKESEVSSPRAATTDKPQQPSVYNLFFKKFKPKRLEEDLEPEEKEPEAEPEIEEPTKHNDEKEDGHENEDVKPDDAKESLVEEEIDVVDDTPLAFHQDSLSDFLSLLTTTNPRQSLILLEEVDILFEDDKGFWGSIATLAAKSKRPIVMTCNDPMLIPAGILKIQEHLRFERPCTSELFRYLECICRVEGHVYPPGTLEGLIEEGQHDTRRIMMQLQLSASAPSKEDSPKDQQPISRPSGPTGARKGPQRLLRITSKGVQSATMPSTPATTPASIRAVATPSDGRCSPLTKEQIQMQFNELVELAEDLSLVDSFLKMNGNRAFQHFENDQSGPLKDDEQGVRFLFKEPTAGDHLSRDVEIAEFVEDGARALFGGQDNATGAEQSAISAIAESACVYTTDVNKYYTQPSSDQSRYVSRVASSLERLVPVQIQCHQQRNVFNMYASALRDMVLADDLNSTIPSVMEAFLDAIYFFIRFNRCPDSTYLKLENKTDAISMWIFAFEDEYCGTEDCGKNGVRSTMVKQSSTRTLLVSLRCNLK
ncbi:hypothetical protein BGZ73_007775 [Actinomortierella ambigua]|nr:hypothetical protein BGZ73_007775 [Actinomortierella ambigua]